MHTLTRTRLSLLLAATVFAAGTAVADDAPDARTRSLEQKINELAAQLQALQGELKAVKTQNEALAEQQQQQAVLAQGAASAESSGGDQPADKLSLWGYGELNYTDPVHQKNAATADLTRAVFGIGYRFDDRTVFNSEFEIEHAVSSAEDAGEFEVEQFFVDHQLAPWGSVRAGLFLMPFGLLNERHEPTNYFGVYRNFVETLIIPSTWREGGLSLHGNSESGLSWDAGLTTGFNLANFDPNPFSPLYTSALDNMEGSPLQMTHQELSLARADSLSQYLSLNYRGIPGLQLGAAAFTGKTSYANDPNYPGLPSQRLLLWETHMRWTPGAADLSAVYAHGSISHTAEFNQANPGASNSMPAEFEGYYLQGAYRVWESGSYSMVPFARWEHYNLGAKYEGIAPGFDPVLTGPNFGELWPIAHDDVWTVGANFYLNPNVVFKADYQNFKYNTTFDRVDLGLGLTF